MHLINGDYFEVLTCYGYRKFCIAIPKLHVGICKILTKSSATELREEKKKRSFNSKAASGDTLIKTIYWRECKLCDYTIWICRLIVILEWLLNIMCHNLQFFFLNFFFMTRRCGSFDCTLMAPDDFRMNINAQYFFLFATFCESLMNKHNSNDWQLNMMNALRFHWLHFNILIHQLKRFSDYLFVCVWNYIHP